MKSISLVVYAVEVFNNDISDYVELDDLDGSGTNTIRLKDLLLEFLEDTSINVDNLTKKMMIPQKIQKNENLTEIQKKHIFISGIINSGDFGYTSELRNIKTGEVSHKRTLDEAEGIPFYFNFLILDNRKKGFCVFEKFSVNGIKSIFEDRFNEFIKKKGFNFKISLGTLTLLKYVEEYFNNRITRVRFQNYNIEKDIADKYCSNSNNNDVYEEYSIIAKRNGKINNIGQKLLNGIKNKTSICNIVQLKDFKYDKIKVDVEINGKKKSIDLSKIQEINTAIDITEDVVMDESNGHPKFESINEIAKDYAVQFYKDSGL